jgi:filamentous hemagglutinin family protein
VVLRQAGFAWLALLAALVPRAASAQHITVDGSLSRARTLHGPNYQIGANLGRQVGGNLFQSFGIFGLAAGESATFTGPASVGNIIGRVTGGRMSSIDGAIRSKIPGANVYLINPYGVVFGPQGTVSVSGSFYASTANYLKTTDGARFRATHPQASVLSAAPPAAFGFLSAKPPAITVNGSMLTARGTIGLVAGPVAIRQGAKIEAPSGTIDVASVAGKGEVPVAPRGTTLTVRRFGRATITGGALLDVSNSTSRGRSGSVFIRSASLAIDASTINADNYGARPGGEIVLQTGGRVAVRDGAALAAFAYGSGRGAKAIIGTAPTGSILLDDGYLLVGTEGAAAGGRLSVATGRLILRDGAELGSVAAGTGNAGPMRVAAGSILIDGRADPDLPTELGSLTLAAGNAGNVTISTGSLRILANGEIVGDTDDLGNGSTVVVDVRGALSIDANGASKLTGIFTQANPESSGNAGRLVIAAGSLAVTDGGEISASTGAPGAGGDVSVRVVHGLRIEDQAGIFSNTFDGANAGQVSVDAGALLLEAGGQISASTTSTGAGGHVVVAVSGELTIDGVASGIFSNTTAVGGGRAGNISIGARALTILTNGEISSSTGGSGDAGNVSVRVPGRLVIDGISAVGLTGIVSDVAQLTTTGEAGHVSVIAGELSILADGEISSGTFGSGDGGSISVRVSNALNIDGKNAAPGRVTGIATSADSDSTGNAGNLTVVAGSISLTNGGEISASTFSTGMGGTVAVRDAGNLVIDGAAGTGATGIFSNTSAAGGGNAGPITVSAKTLRILTNGEISSSTDASGNAGMTKVLVAGGLTIDGINETGLTGIVSQNGKRKSSGQAAGVAVIARNLTILANGEISSGTFGSGNAGKVSVDVSNLLMINGAKTQGDILTGITTNAAISSIGNAGAASVVARELTITNGGTISSIAEGLGTAGAVRATAETLTISNLGSISASTAGSGAASKVTVDAARLTLTNSGTILAVTYGHGVGGDIDITTGTLAIVRDGIISSDSAAGSSGNAGNVMIAARDLSIVGGLISSDTLPAFGGAPASTGNGGDVMVKARSAKIASGEIDSNTHGTGQAGRVSLDVTGDRAGALQILAGGEIGAGTFGIGNGGRIVVDVAGGLLIDGAGTSGLTGIAAQANSGSTGNAGDVVVNAGSVSMLDGGVISSSIV